MNWTKRVQEKHPLIECLTNSVTMTDVANAILAVGGSPVMGMAVEEVREFVRISSGVLLNVGTVLAYDVPAFEAAMAAALEFHKPLVFDPVGMGAAAFRTNLTTRLLETWPCAVIKGNGSEIRCLARGCGATSGVDVVAGEEATAANLEECVAVATSVAAKYKCVVAMTGPIDIVCDTARCYICDRGVEWMNRVTGTGCLLGGVCAAYAAAAWRENAVLEAVAQAVARLGRAGERADDRTKNAGLGSFHVALLDELSAEDADRNMTIQDEGKWIRLH